MSVAVVPVAITCTTSNSSSVIGGRLGNVCGVASWLQRRTTVPPLRMRMLFVPRNEALSEGVITRVALVGDDGVFGNWFASYAISYLPDGITTAIGSPIGRGSVEVRQCLPEERRIRMQGIERQKVDDRILKQLALLIIRQHAIEFGRIAHYSFSLVQRMCRCDRISAFNLSISKRWALSSPSSRSIVVMARSAASLIAFAGSFIGDRHD